MLRNLTKSIPLVALITMLSACGDNNADSEADGTTQVEAQHSDHDDHDQDSKSDHSADGYDSDQSADDHDGHDQHPDSDHSTDSDIVPLDASAAQEAGILVERAALMTVERKLSLPAEIRFDANRIANVSPQVSGVIRRLYASEGDSVDLGDRLALLSSRELATLKADYLSALSAESLARAALSREEQLWSERITSEADLLSARAAATAAKASRESAENKLHAVGLDHSVIDSLDRAADGALGGVRVDGGGGARVHPLRSRRALSTLPNRPSSLTT